MSEAIENIVSHYVRLKDRVALERMREHRHKLLHDYRIHAAQGFGVPALETALQDDVNALDEGLSRLET